MKYFIHTCNKRLWYVNEYLVPSMLEQGIPKEDIIVWNDEKQLGNLHSFIASCEWIGENLDIDAGCWHLQDDVLICSDFAKRTQNVYNNDSAIAGFTTYVFNKCRIDKIGKVSNEYIWMSFPCIYIPNRMLNSFLLWFRRMIAGGYFRKQYESGKMDDFFFVKYLKTVNRCSCCYNLRPCLVEHIDYLIGGSSIPERENRKNIHCAYYWEEPELVEQLKEKLKMGGRLDDD